MRVTTTSGNLSPPGTRPPPVPETAEVPHLVR